MGKMSKQKGKKGEAEALDWLINNLPWEELKTTNLQNFGTIGDDLELGDYSIEVKRRENLDIQTWWQQCVTNADRKDKEPVLMFRQNRKDWRFVISARNLGLARGYIELSKIAFVDFMTDRLTRPHKPYVQSI